jgi:hypothetical protein
LIVYTAIYGGYDPLLPHAPHPSVDRWVCYTDDPDLHCGGWETVVVPSTLHPRLAAKWWKCHPPAYESLWIDGSFTMVDSGIVDVVAGHDLSLFRHPDRDNILDEAEVSAGMQKYADWPIIAQVQRYGSNVQGLWASGVIGRRNSPRICSLGGAWFAHCELLTYQDQLSLPVLLAEYEITPTEIPHTVWTNPWLVWRGHGSDA